MLKSLWPLLKVNLRILGLIWQGTAYSVQNNTTKTNLATLDELRASCHRRPNFGGKLETRRHKKVHIFNFLQSDMVLGIVNPFSWIFNASCSYKSCLISMLFLLTYIDIRAVKFFPPAESWLVNSNFRRASRMQGHAGLLMDLSRTQFGSFNTF